MIRILRSVVRTSQHEKARYLAIYHLTLASKEVREDKELTKIFWEIMDYLLANRSNSYLFQMNLWATNNTASHPCNLLHLANKSPNRKRMYWV